MSAWGLFANAFASSTTRLRLFGENISERTLIHNFFLQTIKL